MCEAAPLADREVLHALVAADDCAVGVDHQAGLRVEALVDERAVVAAGDEADVGAVGLVGHGEVVALGDGADLVLAQLADREAGHREGALAEGVEEVGLVLVGVEAAVQGGAAVDIRDARVVAGGEPVGAERFGLVEEAVELDVGVAVEAGVGRAAAAVLGDERLDDVLEKLALQIQRVVRDAEPVGDAAGVLDILDAAALGAARQAFGPGLGPEAHGDADHLVALLDEQRRGDGRIDPTAHAHDDSLRHGAARC